MQVPLPENEAVRLQALRACAILDTPPEQPFDDIAGLAAQTCEVPMAALSLVDTDRQWFKARIGLEMAEMPREHAFCAHAILNPAEVMVVPDAHRDQRFAANPIVTDEPHIRFYAGAPLVTSSGEALGTLCVMDRDSRSIGEEKVNSLQALARLAIAQLEMRQREVAALQSELQIAREKTLELEAQLARQKAVQMALSEESSFRKAVIERAAEGICVCHGIEAFPFVEFSVWNRRMAEITGRTMEEINRLGWYQTVYPDPETQERARKRMDRMRQGEDLRQERWEITRPDGQIRAVSISTSVLTSSDGRVHVLALMYDLTEEENLQQEAAKARKDGLTGVGTRRAFEEDGERLLRLACRQGVPVALGFMDLDDLKSVNDAFGHAEGDRLLGALGAALSNSARSTDLVGRLGGDEFAILLPDTDMVGARVFFDRLHERVLNVIRDQGWGIGLSIGVAVFRGATASQRDALEQADALMYEAKRRGKNRVVYEEFRGVEKSPHSRSVSARRRR